VGHEGAVNSIAVLLDGKRAVTGSEEEVKVWELESGQELQCFEIDEAVLAFAVLPSGKHIFTSSLDRTLRLWDLETGKQLTAFTCDTVFRCCALAPDGRFVIVGDGLGQVQVLEIRL
jgi:WD40 repeat protein